MSSVSNFKINGSASNPLVGLGRPFTVTATVVNTSSQTMTSVSFEVEFKREMPGGTTAVYATYGRAQFSLASNKSTTIEIECVIPTSYQSKFKDFYGADLEGAVVSGVKTRVTYQYQSSQTAVGGMLLPASTGFRAYIESYNPQITHLSAWRYITSTSAPNDEGEKIAIRYGLKTDTEYDSFSVSGTISDGTNTYTLSLTKPTSGGIITASAPTTRAYSNGVEWTIRLSFSDGYETVTRECTVARAFANIHLSGAMTAGKQVGGVCFGGFSSVKDGDTEGKFECYYPAYFYGGIVEGGSAGDYSTEEQDTGAKWVDGKTIYQRTFVKTALKTVSSATNADIATISGIGIETVIEMKGICKQSSGANHPIPGWYSADNFRHPYTSQDGQYLRLRHNEGSTSTTMDVYITMFYTKS